MLDDNKIIVITVTTTMLKKMSSKKMSSCRKKSVLLLLSMTCGLKKFKAQQTNAFFGTVNQIFGGSSQLPTTVKRAVIGSNR